MQAADLLELRDDLTRETWRLEQLVEGLVALDSRLSSGGETVEAAALRQHRKVISRALLLIEQGGSPTQPFQR